MNKKQDIIQKKNKLKNQLAGRTKITSNSIIKACDQFSSFIINKKLDISNEVIEYARPPIIFGMYIILIFIICGGIWASFAPLATAAHAPGIVISNIDRQRIQSTQSGKVKKFFLKQGDFVNKDQVLLELEGNDINANYEIALNNYLDHLALRDRLMAQRDGLNEINFSPILIENKNSSRVKKLILTQNNIFIQTQQHILNYNNYIKEQRLKHSSKIQAYASQKFALTQQLNNISEELKINKELENQGLSCKFDSSTLFTQKMKIKGEISNIDSAKFSVEKDINCLELEQSKQMSKTLEDVLQKLQENNNKLLEAREHLILAQEKLKGKLIKSPLNGIVNEITQNVIISAHAPIAEVTPIDNLVISAKVAPEYIDCVKVGQNAKIKFTSFKSRTSPTFKGKVISLSPNVVDETGQRQMQQKKSYVTKIIMDQESLNKFLKPRNLKLMPGMIADVNIITGERTLLRYLLDPIIDQAFKSFNEK